jgi:hypothetical protein
LKDPWLHFDVLVQNQSFINRRSRVYTAKYLKPSKSRVELFTQKATVSQLEKAGTLDLSSTEQFWNSALPMIDEISVTKKWPIYVINKEVTLFPGNSLNYWFLFFIISCIFKIFPHFTSIFPLLTGSLLLM